MERSKIRVSPEDLEKFVKNEFYTLTVKLPRSDFARLEESKVLRDYRNAINAMSGHWLYLGESNNLKGQKEETIAMRCDVQVNGKQIKAIIDTGASVSIITNTLRKN